MVSEGFCLPKAFDRNRGDSEALLSLYELHSGFGFGILGFRFRDTFKHEPHAAGRMDTERSSVNHAFLCSQVRPIIGR